MKHPYCLIEVTASFYKAGERVDEDLEENYQVTSYGDFLGKESEEYWEYLEELTPKNGVIASIPRNYYKILKDFIAFSFMIVSWGDDTDGRLGAYFHESSVDEDILHNEDWDVLTEYANKVKYDLEGDRSRILWRTSHLDLFALEKKEINRVRFLIAMEVGGSQDYWTGEYDSWSEITGLVDMSKIGSLIVRDDDKAK